MNKTVKIVLVVVGAWVGLGVVSMLVGGYGSNPTTNQKAYDNTFRNGFIVACEDEVNKSGVDSLEAKSLCSCGYDQLIEMYPDFTTNNERINRIINDGYNKTEARAVQECI